MGGVSNELWAWLARDMVLVIILAVVAALYGLVRGGSLDGLARTQFRFVWVLFAGLVLQLGVGMWDPAWLSEDGALAVVLVSNVAVALFLALNRHLPGMWLAALGLLLNALVIGANGAMPVSLDAGDLAGPGSEAEFGIKHEAMGPDTLLPWIADVIPVPGLRMILSIGDLFLAAGIGWLVYKRTLEGDASDEKPATPAETSG